MFYSKAKKTALSEHEKAVKEYNSTYKSLETLCKSLYDKRQGTISVLNNIENLVNTIANTPKEFEKNIVSINSQKNSFKETETYAKEAIDTIKKSSVGAAAGVADGTAVASLAPTAAMWVATTFGTASTGTAISTLSGAVATNAALAWLGGGALTAGGGGMAAGSALLALSGPIGWGIAGVATATSLLFVGRKNKKVADKAVLETKKIHKARGVVSNQVAKIRIINKETDALLTQLRIAYYDLKSCANKDYLTLDEQEKMSLGTLVNNAYVAAEMLNKTI